MGMNSVFPLIQTSALSVAVPVAGPRYNLIKTTIASNEANNNVAAYGAVAKGKPGVARAPQGARLNYRIIRPEIVRVTIATDMHSTKRASREMETTPNRDLTIRLVLRHPPFSGCRKLHVQIGGRPR